MHALQIKDLRKEIDSRALQQLACLSPEVAVAVLDQLSDVRFEGIENKYVLSCYTSNSGGSLSPPYMLNPCIVYLSIPAASPRPPNSKSSHNYHPTSLSLTHQDIVPLRPHEQLQMLRPLPDDP